MVGLCMAVSMIACGDGTTDPPPPLDPPRATTVTVTPATAELTALGATVRLSADVRDQNGQAMAGAAVSWASGAADVATVSSSGLVTAAGNGAATITASAGSASGSATVAVAQAVAAVAVSPPADTLVAFGDTVRLAAEATDANGHVVTGSTFSWLSGDTLVAWVDETGLVESAAEGAVAVTATASGVAGRAELSVVPPLPTTVAMSADTLRFTALGQTAQLAVEVREQAGRVMAQAIVSWTSGDTLVAAVDSAGLVNAVSGGTTTVSATAGEVSGEVVVTVTQAAGSVVLTPASGAVALGDTLRLTAEAFDENGHRVDGAAFAWSSSDVSVATVDASGLVAGVAEGAATITAMAGSVQGTARITVANPDRAALVALYEATDGPNWVNSENWLTDAPLGDWYGVEINHAGRVVRLELGGRRDEAGQWTSHGLSGSLPRELGQLTELVRLRLDRNQLTGPIPSELGDLLRLRVLHLGGNQLTGSIPAELGNLAALTWLDIGGNQLTGPIPSQLGNLTKLEGLLLANAHTGPIPSELGNLAHLTYLALSGNALSGPIPSHLGKLAALTELHLGNNDLSGSIPPELGNLAKLANLRLFNNRLDGPLPPELGNLSRLRNLDVSGNRLEGSVPPEIGGLEELVYLRLGRNAALSGPLPTTLSALTSLRILGFEESGLCAPGTATFREWLRGVETVRGDNCAGFDIAVLTSLYHATNGAGWHESGGWLGEGALEEWYGVTADSLGRVVTLDLSRNGLAGELPSDLGDLDRLIDLRIGGNGLTGGLPLSLARLSLQVFRYADTELCVPAHESYQAWLNAIPRHDGTGVPCPLPPDREILEALYEATDGPNWTHNENWLGDAPLNDWYGVDVDEGGRVVGLRLSGNNLRGPIPPELGELANLRTLDLSRNNLAGSIPLELGYLVKLRTFNLRASNLGGTIPPELGNLAELRDLHVGYNELTGPIPPELGKLADLRTLGLHGSWDRRVSRLEGPIPPELGKLVNLRRLDLSLNHLTGSIPSELSELANLEQLGLERNRLSGPIPSELGKLAKLKRLSLITNGLTGPIPPELGKLSGLERLELKQNGLTGPIPPELGSLGGLVKLDLGSNGLTGSIPAALGNLSYAEELLLEDNDLSGSVPPTFSGLSSLRWLYLANNAALAGPLPIGLTALRQLEELVAGQTDLCAPSDPGFATWLEGVRKRRIARCAEGSQPPVYLTQAVQSREFPVPLVAGRKALLRVFVTAARATSAGIPRVRARFYVNGRETHVADIPGKATPIPTEVTEGDLAKSANADIPDHVVQPGLEMVLEVDPDQTLDPGLRVPKRIPEEGRLAVEVRTVPAFRLTIVPFLWRTAPDSAVLSITRAMAADPENHPLLQPTFTLLPVGDADAMLHEPVLSWNNRVGPLHRETTAIRAMEGGTGHWLGTMTGQFSGTPAGAGGSNRVTFSVIDGPGHWWHVIAHEVGHNMSLEHPPPRYQDPTATHTIDFAYPHPNQSIGGWGYDFRDGGSLVAPSRPDVMGSTNPSAWVSDYHFTNALRFRLVDEAATTAGTAVAAKSLLLWGGTDSEGVPVLEPAFVVEAPAALPDSAGEHRITGRTAEGAEVFSLSFAMPEAAHGHGSSSFAFVLPVRPEWESSLAAITLDGPGGSATLDGESDIPMAILRNPVNGQVRGFLPDPAAAIAADGTVAADAASPVGQDIEVLFSRGLPGSREWRR